MVNFLSHLFLPHSTNNFRARLLHLDFFALYVVAFFLLSISFRTVHRISPDILGFATDIHVDQLISLTNEKRIESGLPALNLNSQLSQAAAAKAKHMFLNNYWAHTAPDGATPWDFINGAGYVYSVAGENLAKNFSNSQGVVGAWMNSSSHRENILRLQYADIGFAVVNGVLNGEETTLVVQMFGKSVGTTISQKEETAKEEAETLIAVSQAQAEESEEATPVAQIAGLMPTPQPDRVSLSEKRLEITPTADSVVKTPLFDISKVIKLLTLGLSTLLMLVLVADALYVSRKNIVRVGGKTVAHLVFLFAVTGIIWFMSFGSII